MDNDQVVIPFVTLREHSIDMAREVLEVLPATHTVTWDYLCQAVGTSEWVLSNVLHMLCVHEMAGRSNLRSHKKSRFWRTGDEPLLDWDSHNILLFTRLHPDCEISVHDLMRNMCWTFEQDEWATRKRKITWRCLMLCAYGRLSMKEYNAHKVYFQHHTSSSNSNEQ